MPLVKVDIVKGRNEADIKALLDAIHRVVLSAFKVPQGDRYQILNEHAPGRMIIEDTGLGIPRTEDVVVVQLTTRPRPRDQKEAFYHALTQELAEQCGIAPSDVVITLVENSDEDWSFGHGRAQFLTGEL